MSLAYLDASALAKLAVREAESEALQAAATSFDLLATSIVGSIELGRLVRRRLPIDVAQDVIDTVLHGITIVPLDVATAAVAGRLLPARLRSLDAIHLATLTALGDDLPTCFCYDVRLADAARDAGFTVLAPA